MNSLLIYKGVWIVKSVDELKIGDKVKILDGYDVQNRELQMFPVGTVGTIIEDRRSGGCYSLYAFRVEARVNGLRNRWWYSKKQVAPVEEELDG